MEAGDAAMSADLHALSAGDVYALHWHDYYELELVLEGEGLHRHNDAEYPIGPGSAYLMSFFDYHSLRTTTPMKILNVSFRRAFMPDALAGALQAGPRRYSCRFDGEDFAYMRELGGRLLRGDSDGGSLAEFRGRALLSLMLTEVIRKADPSPSARANSLAQKAVAFIQGNYDRDISLSGIASRLSVTPTYLGTVFRRDVGMSFNGYLNTVRLRYACGLLTSTDLSVKEIAAASGYGSTEYFLYVFRRKLGMTPGAYKAISASG
jgi:AraC-like DNA-binding protein